MLPWSTAMFPQLRALYHQLRANSGGQEEKNMPETGGSCLGGVDHARAGILCSPPAGSTGGADGLAFLRTTSCCNRPSWTASVWCGAPSTALPCCLVGEIYLLTSLFLVILFGTLKACVQQDGELPPYLMLSFSPHEVGFGPLRHPLDM